MNSELRTKFLALIDEAKTWADYACNEATSAEEAADEAYNQANTAEDEADRAVSEAQNASCSAVAAYEHASEASAQACEAKNSAQRVLDELEALQELLEEKTEDDLEEADSEPICEATVSSEYSEVKDVFK